MVDQPFYEEDSTLSTIKCYRGGTLQPGLGSDFYIGGKVDYVDNQDYDRFCKFDLDEIAETLELSQPCGYNNRRHDQPISSALVRVMDDEGIKLMVEDLRTTKVVEVYFIEKPSPTIEMDLSGNNLEGYVQESQPLLGSQQLAESRNTNKLIYEKELSHWKDILTNNQAFEEFCGFQPHVNSGEKNATIMQDDLNMGIQDKEGDSHVSLSGENADENGDEPEFNDFDYEQEPEQIVQDEDDDSNLEYFQTDFSWFEEHQMEYEGTEDGNSEDLESVHSDDEDGATRKNSGHVYKGPADNEDCKFELDMIFPNKQLLKWLIIQYSIKQARPIDIKKDDNIRVLARCVKGCPWVLYARVIPGSTSYRINTLNMNHTCAMTFDNKWATSSFFAKKYLNTFRNQPNLNFDSFESIVKEYCGKSPSRAQFYRTKSKCLKLIRGSNDAQYQFLVDYMSELKKSNEGTMCVMQTEMVGEAREFRRIYVCLPALRDGFRAGCRRVVGLDGCYLRGDLGGHILSAVGIDAENAMFPIAYAVVESECKDSWNWFLELLIEDIQMQNSFGWTFISDKQKGLIDALKTWVPNAEHRFCVRHLYTNFRGKFAGIELKLMLWAAARAPNLAEWNMHMDRMKAYNSKAHEWLTGKLATEWSRSHFGELNKCDILLNNLCESFNAAIVNARDKPIFCLLEKIKVYLMTRMATKRDSVSKWKQEFAPKICKILDKTKNESRFCRATHAGNQLFEVMDGSGTKEAVDLGRKECTCRKFQLTGLPCCHAISAIFSRWLQVDDYVDQYYNKEAFLRAYTPVIHPMPGPEMWVNKGKQPVHAPPYRKQPGRPKKARRREVGEGPAKGNKRGRHGTVIRCSYYKKPGHNRK